MALGFFGVVGEVGDASDEVEGVGGVGGGQGAGDRLGGPAAYGVGGRPGGGQADDHALGGVGVLVKNRLIRVGSPRIRSRGRGPIAPVPGIGHRSSHNGHRGSPNLSLQGLGIPRGVDNHDLGHQRLGARGLACNA